MEYDKDFLLKIRDRSVQADALRELKKMLLKDSSFELIKRTSVVKTLEIVNEISDDLRFVKDAAINCDKFIDRILIEFDDVTCSNVLKQLEEEAKTVPKSLLAPFAEYKDVLMLNARDDLKERMRTFVRVLKRSVAEISDQKTQAENFQSKILDVWAFFEGRNDKEAFLGPVVESYKKEVLIKFPERDPGPVLKSERKFNPYVNKIEEAQQASYAEKATPQENHPEEVDEEEESPKKWGDYSSSDEEDDSISSMLKTFGKAGISSKPNIEIPKDFENQFPDIYNAWKTLTTKWNWTIKVLPDCQIASEGFIGKNFGKAKDQERVKIISELKDDKRVALNTFIAFLVSVCYRPETILSNEQASLVSGFVTSLFLKKKYGKSDRNSKFLKTSLKGSDAGESVIRLRVLACFQTGNKCPDVITKAVIKMLNKIVSTAGPEDVDSVLAHSDLCFTSPQGMMENSFRTVQKRFTEISDTTDKRGRRKRVRNSVMRPGKDRPQLNAKSLELSQKEFEIVRAKESSFNKLDELVLSILELKKESKDPLKTAKTVKYVIDLAYEKVKGIRRINKIRRDAIRAHARELAGEEKNLTSSDWAKAKNDLMSSFEEIDNETLCSLDWNIERILEGLNLD